MIIDVSKEENKRSVEEVIKIAKSHMKKHGLLDIGWTFKLDKAKRRAGVCKFTSRVIGVSTDYALKSPLPSLINTILHEIAHALAGHNHNHDDVWKKTALSIGCTGDRCHAIKFASGKIIQTCVNKCFTPREMHRRPPKADKRLCKKCRTPVIYKTNES